MKKALRIAFLLGLAGFVIAILRNKVAPRPEPPLDAPPPFRAGHPGHQPEPPATRAEPHDDLTDVKGIGPVYSERLRDLGISSFAALIAADPDEIAAQLELGRETIVDWQAQAETLTA